MTYTFTFDASSCSGCKACQAACKDKNSLPTGVLWRRVYEVSGGTWTNVGAGSPCPSIAPARPKLIDETGVDENGVGQPDPYAVWQNTVFAYNLSMACNHCEHPKCAGVCPVDAYVIRPDGIVYIDESKCVGCGYCSWACPYGAPQYNPTLGHMTKCNFCFDYIDAGQPPACVAACPLRVLNFATIDDGQWTMDNGQSSAVYRPLWETPASEHPFPMSPTSHTQPHLAIKPHKAMNVSETKHLANREEIHPRHISAWEEAPLIVFTLLGQMAVGGFFSMLWMFPPLWSRADLGLPLRLLPYLLVGLALGIGMMASFAHLGTKRNAWRVLNHLRKSWLSREILMSALFGAGWLASTLTTLLWQRPQPELHWLTALLGFGLVHSMAQVYRLPSVPAWDTPRTNLRFTLTALLLGHLGMTAVLAYASARAGETASPVQWWSACGIALALLAAQVFVMIDRPRSRSIRLTLWLAALAVITTMMFVPAALRPGLSLAAFALTLAGQVWERWLFYTLRE